MIQSTLHTSVGPGLHVAIIMDGNGRWAEARGRSRSHGHRAGARAVEQLLRPARDLGIDTLTLYAFSGDNWKRPASEVRTLMRLFQAYLRTQAARCAREGVRVRVIGRRDRLAPPLLREIEAAESATAQGSELDLHIALDYSGRDALLAAAWGGDGRPVDRSAFRRRLGDAIHAGGPSRDVDLLIRTGGEQRLSDFLLWECAYAELYFTDTLWPDFGPTELAAAVGDYHKRERRFGALPEAAAGPAAPARPDAMSTPDQGGSRDRESERETVAG